MFRLNPCKPSNVPIQVLPAAKVIEGPNHYYPIRLYEILNDRYQITAKLGWGTSSTAWLARDLNQYVNNYATKEDAVRDLRITEKITHANPQHVGRDCPHGLHVCMVFDPLCEPLWMLKQRFHDDVLPLDVLKPVAKLILEGLGYLHSQCQIVHTDHSILDKVSQDEIKEPLPQKQLEDRTIYLSRNHFGVEANDGSRAHYHPIQPDSSRAPEVILGAGWSYSADIWNLAALEAHLARIISVLGTSPVDMLRESRNSSRYFDAEGRFKHPELISESGGLEKIISSVEGDNKRAFLDLVSRMLRWRADERDTVQGLLSDPWFQGL
ncbi:hypothetical protein ASPNIDRAFT_124017 [Aspergillus niger ATCC 1015]|uniref:non-specific serine/threonine protein kinase n=1 Tax=Aspergillus niger (strain ATCC 1015 / CBS 113.46 / FGSC A1144 / LSHB Ac4 / NCTC 3858a / NRRL 328 / USDA 3528.7) TaxID=380704 RepID=G3YA93_ASPNA|nr:hypothetical protein ASPNIDRAFT_124017 [Aspergillus niger ATCC 1015]